MSVSTQNISALEWKDVQFSSLRKRELTILFDAEHYVIHINKDFTPPVSWFLTDDLGELAIMGQIKDYTFQIDLTGLVPGIYFLRIAGEVHQISHSL